MKRGIFIIVLFFIFILQSFFLYKEFAINRKLDKTIKQESLIKSQSVCDSILNFYKSKPIAAYNEKPVKVDFDSMPELNSFHTVITEEAAKGPNFAGHFTFIKWGCGTSCLSYAIVDAISGKIVLYEPVIENLIPSYAINSRILVFNEKNEFKHLEGKSLNEIISFIDTESGKLREYYEFVEENNDKFWLYRLCSENVLDGIYLLDKDNL